MKGDTGEVNGLLSDMVKLIALTPSYLLLKTGVLGVWDLLLNTRESESLIFDSASFLNEEFPVLLIANCFLSSYLDLFLLPIPKNYLMSLSLISSSFL